jgi:hypothetical protein
MRGNIPPPSIRLGVVLSEAQGQLTLLTINPFPYRQTSYIQTAHGI